MSRARALLLSLGLPGILAVGILVFCASFYYSALRPAEQEIAAQSVAAERLRNRGPFQPVSADRRAEELRRFYTLFPAGDRLADQLGALHTLAREARLELLDGEYRLENRSSGLAAYRITLPVRGTYPQVRSFLDAVLKDVPTASVDGLRFERKKAAEDQVEAQVRLTLYFQPGDEPR